MEFVVSIHIFEEQLHIMANILCIRVQVNFLVIQQNTAILRMYLQQDSRYANHLPQRVLIILFT